jgi:hypothetical protein
VTVTELEKMSGISRQWLNKLADRGKLPGCTKGPTERLVIRFTPALKAWIAQARKKGERAAARNAKFRQKFDGCYPPEGAETLRASDLAKRTRLSARTINRRAEEIPGRIPSGTGRQSRWVPCLELYEWIDENRVRLLDVEPQFKRALFYLKKAADLFDFIDQKWPEWTEDPEWANKADFAFRDFDNRTIEIQKRVEPESFFDSLSEAIKENLAPASLSHSATGL